MNLLPPFKASKDHIAIWWNDQSFSYQWLNEQIEHFESALNIPAGSVVSIEGSFGVAWIPLLLALINKKCIIVPLIESSKLSVKKTIAEVEFKIETDGSQIIQTGLQVTSENLIYHKIRENSDAGLVLFTTGSTGQPKAAVHSVSRLLNRYKFKNTPCRVLSFLAFDHMGGLHTALSSFFSGGTLVCPKDRSPETICETIEKARVEILPVTPTFLRALILSQKWKVYDLSSLRRITYGAEPMPQSVLNQIRLLFPNAELKQTYGLTELGVLATLSESSESLWIRLSDKYSYRIRDQKLEIKAPTQMLGYLNASYSSNSDWYETGDLVEERNGWLRILGRATEIINVGGWKIHPSEVESVILEMPEVENATVSGEENPLLGQIIRAEISPPQKEGLTEFVKKLRAHCAGKLPTFAIPQKVVFSNEMVATNQIKKIRN